MKEKKEFNFAQRWVDLLASEKKNPSLWKTRAFAWVIVIVLILSIMGSTPWLWEYKLNRDIVLAEDSISLYGDLDNQVKQLKALKAKAEEQEQLLKLMQTSSIDLDPILEELKDVLPAGSNVSSFSLKDNIVSFSVIVPTPVDAARFWSKLRDSGMFLGVDVQTVSMQDQSQSLNFNLTLK